MGTRVIVRFVKSARVKKQQRYSGDKPPIFVRQIRDKNTGKRDKEGLIIMITAN